MLIRVCLALFVALVVHATPALALPDDPAVEGERDEYDFSWLDPEKKIYVVQNRKYNKANRVELGTSYGVGMGETYRKQRQWLVQGMFYFNEHWGVKGFFFNNYNSVNDAYYAVRQVSNRVPAVRDTNSYVGGSVLWLPFYGKVNMFNQIFYIDWHFEAGLGSAKTELDRNTESTGAPIIEYANFSAFHWGSGWKFFINRNWGARLDFLATYYKAPSALNGTVAGSPDYTYDNYYVTLGASYTF